MHNREVSLVFVVDNEEVIASTIAEILRLGGLNAIPFTRSTEALERSRELPPDLLITDVLMPQISGPELALHIQWSHPGCKVLLFSGQWARADAEIAAFEDGLVYQLIAKPIHPRELIKKVREVLGLASAVPMTEEERAHVRTVENMRETIAAVQSEIAITTARRRSARKRSEHHR
ncbi:MAG: response regulator [Acidobacteriota bacterium]